MKFVTECFAPIALTGTRKHTTRSYIVTTEPQIEQVKWIVLFKLLKLWQDSKKKQKN